MSDDKAQQEPSMEDILASIRRILSEDEAEDKPKAPEPVAPEPEPEPEPEPPPPEPEPEPEPAPSFAQDDIDSLFDTPAPAPEPEPPPPPPPPPEPEEDVLELTDDMVMEEQPEEPEPAFDINDFKADLGDFEPAPVMAAASRVMDDYEPPPRRSPPPDDEGLMSPPQIDHGASLLTNLAREIVRQKSFGLGNSSITLEDLVRELLKPILSEWLDQNLPYMIERIVKKEIERMVNRTGEY
jgi:cell pole-organizing protein PopZ